MRLFTAIDLPGNVERKLQQLQDLDLGIRWTPAETLHLTLRFIGEVNTQRKEELIAELSQIQEEAFDLTVEGLGYFPPRKFPRIIWAGIKENARLMNLQTKIERACRATGIDPEQRDFAPHITLGKVRDAAKKEVITFINQYKRFAIEDIPVKTFVLYKSQMDSEGAIHTPLQHFSLNLTKK